MLLATFEGANGEFHVPPGITVGLMASGLLLTMLASASGILGGHPISPFSPSFHKFNFINSILLRLTEVGMSRTLISIKSENLLK